MIHSEQNSPGIQLPCDASCANGPRPGGCLPGCSLQILADLLGTPGAVSPEESDYLLDLHMLLKRRQDAEEALRLFCELRRRLETRHYLAFYRLRRWLQNHIVAEVDWPLRKVGQPLQLPLCLRFYCVEAVRRGCLCAALPHATPDGRPRLRFRFVPLANRPEEHSDSGRQLAKSS